jgi:anti-sigma factor RsiW
VITCERVTPYLTAYAAGELSPATTAWVRTHLRECESCAASSARFAGISASLRAMPDDAFSPPPGFTAAVMGRIAERESHSARRLIPIAPVAPEQLARLPQEVARVVSENRDATMNGAATAAVAAGAAWLAWRAVKGIRRPSTT